MPGAQRRFLILGLDGGTFDLLDPLMDAGDLPFLKSMVRSGVRAPLMSVYPAKTIPAWYSMATGQDPGQLGIYGFTEPNGGPGHSKLVQTFRPAEAMWDRLSRLGMKVGVVNFPLHQGYPLHGFVVPGMFTEQPKTYPTDLRAELERTLGGPYPPELPVHRESERASWIAIATRSVEQRAKIAAALAEHHRPDFMFAMFRETDRLEHQYWSELMRPVAEIPEDLRTFWRTVDAACRTVHEAFRAIGGPEITLVVSDHGHGENQSDFFTNRWLAEEGFLAFREGGDVGGRNLLARILLWTQRRRVGRALALPIAGMLRKGRGEGLGQLLSGATSFEEMAERIDWHRTLAYSYPVPEGIYLNRRNPEVTAATEAALVARLRARLEAYSDARVEVFDPAEIYRGRNFVRAPSLLIRVDGMRTEPRMDFSYPRPLIRDRPQFFYGCGNHRMNGILIGAGDGVRPGATDDGPLSLLDVAPTVLEGMGVSPSPAMNGRSFGRRLGLAA
ncbi:MAG TPA: alkaline phosphatase family protein [Thermoplasmata archaeon]|nr:alkaline phosphatase family protein [Thermoplasmata archaeon]